MAGTTLEPAMSPKRRLTLDEIIGLADEAAAVVGSVKTIVTTAQEASADGDLSDADVQAIEAATQAGIDALQALAAEVVAQATD